MATFTLELWKVLEIEEDPGNGHTIGLGAYPIPSWWEQADRDALNKKIIDHYWSREIAHETISLFQHRLMRKMNEIMPMYVQLYESTRFTFDPLSTYDLHTVRSDDTTENTTRDSIADAKSSTINKSRAVSSNPPQNQLSANGQYATAITDTNGEATGDNATTGRDVTAGEAKLNGTSSTTGRQGSANRLLAEFRANILNIDLSVIEELEELFMGVWDNGQEYLPEEGIYF